MVASSWNAAIKAVLADEGGYTNHPSDPGGPTNYGITLADARAYWKRDATIADMRAMPLSVAMGIYQQRYWNALNCDALPAGVDYAVFDYGVNSGIARAGKVLRRALALADSDWRVTSAVTAAAHATSASVLISTLCMERRNFLKSLKTWPVFGRGWTRRVDHVEREALSMARAAAVPSVRPTPAPPPDKSRARIKTVGGGLAGVAAAMLAIGNMKLAAIGIGVAGIALAVFVWRKTRRAGGKAFGETTI